MTTPEDVMRRDGAPITTTARVGAWLLVTVVFGSTAISIAQILAMCCHG